MNQRNAARLVADLPAHATVVDVGGGASPFPRADYVIDAVPYEQRASLGELDLACPVRYCRETWRQVDLCAHRPWPFADKFFDFAVCSHLLEDVRDPLWICQELSRVAKAGYVEVPSRTLEQSLGVEHPRYAGYYHHRWLVNRTEGCLEFRHKPHVLHTVKEAIVARLGVSQVINPEYAILAFNWEDQLPCREVLEFDEKVVVDELCNYAASARRFPNLTIHVPRSPGEWIKRQWYNWRLLRGGR